MNLDRWYKIAWFFLVLASFCVCIRYCSEVVMAVIGEHEVIALLLAAGVSLGGFFLISKPIGITIVLTLAIVGMTVFNGINLFLAILLCAPMATLFFVKF